MYVPRAANDSGGVIVMAPGPAQGIGNALRTTYPSKKSALPKEFQRLLERLH